MIISVDIETCGLDATKFIMGCLIKENGVKEVFYKKEDMWNYIIELGKKEAKRKKVLNVYAHNHSFDFHGYADLNDPKIVWFCMRPFIAAYKHEGREIIKFLDSLAIFRMNLKSVGELIELPKLDTPEELVSGNITELKKEKVIPYMVRDAEIVLKAVLFLKDKIRDEGVAIKRLYTINQIAINFMVNEFRKVENEHIFWNVKSGQFRRTFRKDEIHGAYRGGRVECWKTGIIENVTYLDCNSLYPYVAMNMRFPDLGSERKTWKPLKIMDKKDVLDKIGICRALVYNKSNVLGLLPIRSASEIYFPKYNKFIIGTWTNQELKLAEQEGYKILDIEWCVLYNDGPNPYKNIIPELYKRRKNGDKFNSYLYKMIMNASFGKMAQHRVNQEIVVDDVEKVELYLKRNYEVIKGIKYKYMYRKKDVEFKPKKYYAPIIPVLINADARIYMYKQFKKIPVQNLVYTDTDSILFMDDGNHGFIDKGAKLGEFKTEFENETMVIYGKKTYSIGEEIKISGFRKRDLTWEQFCEGKVKSKKMITVKTTGDIKLAGKFTEEERDLKEQLEKHEQAQKLFEAQDLYVDYDIEDINYFMPKVNEVIL